MKPIKTIVAACRAVALSVGPIARRLRPEREKCGATGVADELNA